MNQDIFISTVAELEAFLERERLRLSCVRGASRPFTVAWQAMLERLSDRDNVIGVYNGVGASLREAIVDAIRCMHERRH